MHSIKTRYRKLIFKLSASNNPLYLYFYKYVYRPKSNSISSFLDTYSRETDQFSVIQIGANDGITHDPIHKFIKRDQWTGVLLEPQKYVFERFLKHIYRLDHGITTLNAALGYEDELGKIYKIGFSNARWATGLTSFNREVLERAFESGHVQRQLKKEGQVLPQDKATYIIEEEIEIISTETLIQRYDVQQIDLLQIDTEGFDYEVIKMFNLDVNTPNAIIYENIHLSSDDKRASIHYLRDRGYEVRHFGGNTLAVQRESQAIKHLNQE